MIPKAQISWIRGSLGQAWWLVALMVLVFIFTNDKLRITLMKSEKTRVQTPTPTRDRSDLTPFWRSF